MSCISCAARLLNIFFGHLDVVIPRASIAASSHLSITNRPIGPRYMTSRTPCHSIQRHTFLSASRDFHFAPLDERNGAIPLRPKRSPMHDDGGFSGIGAVGQQSKDLQEHASSIAAVSEGSLSSTKVVQKKSRSTPARLARRERRMPSRRFKGDRARPEVKDKATPKIVKQGIEKKSPGWKVAATSKKETGPARRAGKAKISLDEIENTRPRIEPWGIQKRALKEKFEDHGWMPRKRLSPDALEGIRTLHVQYPETYTTPVLAEHFKISPEAIRRILKSKWRPTEEEDEDRRRRWEKRGEHIWTEMAGKGIKPPKPWRQKGIGRLSGSGRRSPDFATLEEQIGMEGARDVITTRVVGEPGKHGSLANTIL